MEAVEDIERNLQIGFERADELHAPSDAAGNRGRRIMQRLIDAESQRPVEVLV